jgi:hypothetical protein
LLSTNTSNTSLLGKLGERYVSRFSWGGGGGGATVSSSSQPTREKTNSINISNPIFFKAFKADLLQNGKLAFLDY